MKYEKTNASNFPFLSYENGVQRGDVRVIERKLYWADEIVRGWGCFVRDMVYWRELNVFEMR